MLLDPYLWITSCKFSHGWKKSVMFVFSCLLLLFVGMWMTALHTESVMNHLQLIPAVIRKIFMTISYEAGPFNIALYARTRQACIYITYFVELIVPWHFIHIFAYLCCVQLCCFAWLNLKLLRWFVHRTLAKDPPPTVLFVYLCILIK